MCFGARVSKHARDCVRIDDADRKADWYVWKMLPLNCTDPEIAREDVENTVVTFSIHGPYAKQLSRCIRIRRHYQKWHSSLLFRFCLHSALEPDTALASGSLKYAAAVTAVVGDF